MIHPSQLLQQKRFLIRIFFPTLVTISLFIASIYVLIIPAVERQLLDRKKELISELTNTVWSMLAEYAGEEASGAMTREEAQHQAIARIQDLRYGKERKDYFWVTDMKPMMIVHPYRTDLNGQDLSEFKDLMGKRVFVEFVNVVRQQHAGYVEYYWQWKDDSAKIVPKLSYVKHFAPWDWVIGTGIYTEDVNLEISRIAGRLLHVSLVITISIVLMLLFIAQQSLRIDLQRTQAETALRESHEKYRSLVEASTEGLLMVLDGALSYSNRKIWEMLDYSEAELAQLRFEHLLPAAPDGSQKQNLSRRLIDGGEIPPSFESHLCRKDGSLIDVVLTATPITFGDKNGFILIVRDISRSKAVDHAPEAGHRKYKSLTDAIDHGVFRAAAGAKGRFLEANPAAAKICGFEIVDELLDISLAELFYDVEDREQFLRTLTSSGAVKNRIVLIKKPDGSASTISISAVLVKDDQGVAQFCDGIIDDVTTQKKVEIERESLIAELQASLLFLHQPISNSIQELPSCDMSTTIRNAALLMNRRRCSAIAVTAQPGDVIGLVTDTDMRERAVAANYDIERPVYEIMSAPVVAISDSALVYEAVMLMHEKGIRHLAVRNANHDVISLVRSRDLLQFHQYSSAVVTWDIRRASTADDIIATQNRRIKLVKALIECSARARTINRVLTTIADTSVAQLLSIAVRELGPPPLPFAFMVLGSEGRGEQTLVTDQDNAIVYQDPPEHQRETAADYFLALGAKVCGWMNDAGYTYCKGEVMAKNPRWRQPLSQWKEYFFDWITTAVPKDLLEFNIFFDFRCAYGDDSLTAELRRFIGATLLDNPPFFLLSAENTLLYKPPIGLFGNIVVESEGDKSKTFNIKDATLPIVNFARIYALRHDMDQTNTIERLDRLYEIGQLSRDSYRELVQAYEQLMLLRFRHQAAAIDKNLPPDNHINPKLLTNIDRAILKQTFSLISTLQKKISYDFKGMI